jgi:uncharacterized SAM-binding protein YcdF (DUF218 family)
LRVVLAAVVLAVVAVSLYLFVFVASDNPRHADAIVVLSGVRSRVDTGLRLRHDGVSRTLVISRDPETWRRADQLCATGAVCFHAHPYSTQGEAEEVGRLAQRRGWKRIVVVTNRYHLFRARLLFKRCLGYAPQMVAASTRAVDYAENIPREWAKLMYQLTFDRAC